MSAPVVAQTAPLTSGQPDAQPGAQVAAQPEAQSDARPDAPRVRVSEVGHSTRAWLDLQSSNVEAAPAQPMLGAEAGLAYRRYMASFSSKIPALYGSALGSGSGSSGSSGMSGGTGSGSN
ncbi:DUF3613 domain-containing protein [Paraburkholderia sp. D15]|uniref:DUF3613 domain-containing protein n=1 Tax=Paraburkholderia sp. D15 TaxID=2880218 RepID=UPI002479229B|nr:DUF3613 domain-containing protein [Paraburkholderia sp. D15]WGS51774.1 DUF3613 domain-containing protein [Paraburkholderia sp. D15]